MKHYTLNLFPITFALVVYPFKTVLQYAADLNREAL